MSKIIVSSMKHFDRTEEQDILNYVSDRKKHGHISIFGLSGTGKTELISSSIKLLHGGDLFSGYTVLHYDASQIPEDCNRDIIYNLLIYKLLQKTIPTEKNQTHVTEGNTFLTFLERAAYKEDIKNNAKKALIASLSLLPTVGTLIYKLLESDLESTAKDYQTNQYLFSEYLDYLSKTTGLIVFIDNMQNLPSEITNDFYELLRQMEDSLLLFTSYTLSKDTPVTRKLIDEHKLYEDSLILHIENVTIDIFDEICSQNLRQEHYNIVRSHLEHYYALVQCGNMREIDELIFQINQGEIDNITETPTLQGIKALNEMKKDIVALASLFPEGIKMSFIERIVKYNHGCNEMQLRQSISDLCRMRYILVGENDTLKVEHEKITQACRQNLEYAEEE